MNRAVLISIVTTGFVVAFLHSAIPTHWLPFVLAGRSRRWSRRRLLGVTAFAACGHVAFTTALGAGVVWLGLNVDRLTGQVFPWIVGGALIAFGLVYIVRHLRGGAHGHHSHVHPAKPSGGAAISDRAVILGLLALLTFSPCEVFLPVYLSGIRYGWPGFALLSLVLAGATFAGMMLFTSLAAAGLELFRLEALERYEGAIVGTLLCVLGLAVMFLET
jgi:nickel/cobalt transporter (NicO) family protein